jgi:hypothetical protein
MSTNEKTKEPNVKIRLIEAWKDCLKKGNPEPTQVRFSWSTAYDFLNLPVNELGSSLADKLIQKGVSALNGEKLIGLQVTIDQKLRENEEPEFHFS